jgi:N-acetylneuraminic acid mutarotase/regulation of enolase protein 1 (concanavalin A-like superfamily)
VRSPTAGSLLLLLLVLLGAISALSGAPQGGWTTETRLPAPIQEVAVTALDGQIYVVGGSLSGDVSNAVRSYDPASRIWTSRAPYPGVGRDHAAIAAVGSYIYLIGGLSDWPQPSVTTVHRYTPAANSWTTVAALPTARGAMGVAVLNGKVYAAGGLTAATSVSDFTVFDPATNAWTALPAMPTARDHLTAAAMNGKFYAIGGRIHGQLCSPLNVVEVYDPGANTWSTGAPMLTARAGHAVGSVNGHIQVFGGEGSSPLCGTIKSVEDYDPATNTWTELPDMPTPRHGIGGATIGTSIYLPGGATWTGSAATPVHERYDASAISTSGPVPSPWASQDIGSVAIPGLARYDNGVFTTQASGANIWGTADSFHYIHQPLVGAGEIVARIDSIAWTHNHAKAAVMIRETLAAGSRHVMLVSHADNSVELVTRSATGGTSALLAAATMPTPLWLKLVRSGSTISAFAGASGGTWTPVGTTNITLPNAVHIGLAVTSHDASKLTSATIDHVTVKAAAGNTPPTVTLTSPANATTYTAPASVSLGASASDSDGTLASVEFFANGVSIARLTAPPYTATWTSVPAGSYTVSATATDNAGASTTSAPASITVATPTTPTGIDEIVIRAAAQAAIVGGWTVTSDATAAGGARLQNPNANAPKLVTPLATPTQAFELSFHADARKAYRLWLRGKALNDDYSNDSVFVQFDGSVGATGEAMWRIGTSSATPVIIEDCSGCGLQGWGWADNAYGTDALGPLVYFAQTGLQRMRIQVREDGLGIDQVVLSAVKYKTVSPGLTKNDTTFLPVTADPPAPGSLPSPWAHQDIGAVGVAGNATHESGVFTVHGGGADIWGTSDGFHYVYQPLSADGEIVARVTSLEPVYAWSKAGVMIRSSLDASSPYAFMLVSASRGVHFQARTSTGASAVTVATGSTSVAPRWVKLVRTGNNIAGFESDTGSTWASIGNVTIASAGTPYIGLAVTSHNTSDAAAATFGSVAVTSASGGNGALPSPWGNQDIGTVGLAGSATHANGVFTVKAAGANIWSTADSFHFVNQPINGNVELVARVTSLQNTDLHAKAGVMLRESLTASSPHVLLDIEPNGRIEFMMRGTAGGTTSLLTTAAQAFPVWLKLARSGSTITASTSNDGAAWTQVGSTTSTIPANAFLGLAATSHNTSTLTTAAIDNVAATALPATAGPISFTRKTIVMGGASAPPGALAVPTFQSPTSLAFAPDGRLYASVMDGRIFAFTLDPVKLTVPNQLAATSVQVLDNIYVKPSVVCDSQGLNCQPQSPPGAGRLVTGIAIHPDSTSGNVMLLVSHSGLGAGKTDMTLYRFGGALTRLTLRPDPQNPGKMAVIEDQDLIVGLPRSREVHAVNGMDVGPDAWLYLTVGGNTNAGRPSTFFAGLPESFLSAAVVRLNLANLLGTPLPLNVTDVTSTADLQPLAGKFELYSTGYRNTYDLVWHSNGRLYLNDNAPNLNQGLTPGSAEGCATPSIDVDTKPDLLHLVTKGSYAGHPNPARGECVWGNGTPYSPDLQPQAGYVPPIASYTSPSANGLTEYRSDAFGGAMKGNLVSALYAGEQPVQRVVLTADGSGVVLKQNLANFTQPLDVIADQNGVIYVAEFGSSALTLLVPTVMGTCPAPGSDPAVTDSDDDGYTDGDERSNATDLCSPASTPSDFNGNKVSDLLDNDDDSDGINDTVDQLFFDARNGAATSVPLTIAWDPGDAAYGGVANSGFTGVQISSHAPVDVASGHALNREGIHPGDAGGHMALWTHDGTAEGSANTQVNALQLGFDSTSNFRIWTRLTQPFAGATPALGHVGGVFFGPNEDNYLRLAILGTATGGRALQLGLEVGGVFTEYGRIALTGAIENLDLFLVGRPGSRTVTAYYDVNATGTMKQLGGTATVPGAWFGSNTPAGNTSLTGVMCSDGAARQIAFVFDFFKIDRVVP